MRSEGRKPGAMEIPARARMTVKALNPYKTVMGDVDGVYGPAGNSPLYVRGECKGPPRPGQSDCASNGICSTDGR